MSLTLEEVKERLLKTFDPDDLLEALQITSEQLLERFEDKLNKGSIEAIEAIKASMPEHEFKGYLKGNALKYLWRYDYKGKPVEDLRKCRWYIERLIKEINE
jgi:hypothetical protein